MAANQDVANVRLAELVAALSLGIDLGFGQPMEHVLRQCLIALRLAERVGRRRGDARSRLLHGPARQRRLPHRRPRAGEVVRRRHRPEGRPSTTTSRPACEPRRRACGGWARAGRRCTACASGSRSRPPGYRELNDMFAHHAAMAAGLARGARAAARRAASPCSTPTSRGTARAGRTGRRARRSRWPRASCSSRSTPRWRTGCAASTAPSRSRGSAPASSSTRRSPTLLCAQAPRDLRRASTRSTAGTP